MFYHALPLLPLSARVSCCCVSQPQSVVSDSLQLLAIGRPVHGESPPTHEGAPQQTRATPDSSQEKQLQHQHVAATKILLPAVHKSFATDLLGPVCCEECERLQMATPPSNNVQKPATATTSSRRATQCSSRNLMPDRSLAALQGP
ncbi:hypothetical protein K491DRAFT_44449 [Lophiostoma macrostomum CBS 122681]|uniref:Secreted protein n=1 Tax=Lophiostoma macrostomum CBS 122681 TaxID=1314788 RepID=A0A6A6SYF8_9PLEO|nr:hypothetical protein K491DRAFT_44449 [Lophiostoma macrostomum CBS 122681]